MTDAKEEKLQDGQQWLSADGSATKGYLAGGCGAAAVVEQKAEPASTGGRRKPEAGSEASASSDDNMAPVAKDLRLKKDDKPKENKVLTDYEILAEGTDLLGEFQLMSSEKSQRATEDKFSTLQGQCNAAGPRLRKKGLVALAKQMVDLSKNLGCAKTILDKAKKHVTATK